jgi:tRNA threonylcarbamoyl adenosine modification protein (Sua5/YciO/YrdC/YwlC family)
VTVGDPRVPTIAVGDPAAVTRAAEALDAGAVIAVPTDTVYGLAARLDRPSSLSDVFVLKGRPDRLALPVLIGGIDQVERLAEVWPDAAASLATRFWPGPLTLVVLARPEVGPLVGGDGASVGIRHPDHRFVTELCAAVGPLAVTSANPHGMPPCTTAADVLDQFKVRPQSSAPHLPMPQRPMLQFVVDGGTCDGVPSTVADCVAMPPVRLRDGAIAWSEIELALG